MREELLRLQQKPRTEAVNKNGSAGPGRLQQSTVKQIMIKKNIIALALAGIISAPVIADEASKPQAGEILRGINMFAPEDPEEGSSMTTLHKAHHLAHKNWGTQWAVDMAYGYWHSNNATEGANRHSNYALLHAQLNQRLIEDNLNGGTWLRVEISGSWGLDGRSAASDRVFSDFYAETSGVHADIYGPHDLVIPEVALMHYFNGSRACIIAGMVNMTNYFDAVGIANDSFHSFTNGGFVNSTVLALPDANLGAVLQVELSPKSYAMIGASRETTSYGYNPFTTGGSSYMIVGEYGHTILDDAATIRLNPFYRQVEDGDKNRRNAGIAASIEYTLSDGLTVFARSGFGAKQDLGNAFDFSCGANVRILPWREDDFLGIAFGVFKGTNTPDEPTASNREYVTEVMYSYQVNEWLKLVPHFQYIADPAYREDGGSEVLAGFQAVLSF